MSAPAALEPPPKVEEPGFPWLYTAVDLITQCVMFMVLVTTFGVTILGVRKPEPKPQPAAEPEKKDQKEEERKRLAKLLADKDLAQAVSLMEKQGNLTLMLKDAIFFDSGKAALKASSHKILAQLGTGLASESYEIRVEGYTDNVPIRTRAFPSNWELSAARAIAVLRELQGHGVAADRLAAAGYGEFHPRFPNNSSANRAANRRVEIVLVLRK